MFTQIENMLTSKGIGLIFIALSFVLHQSIKQLTKLLEKNLTFQLFFPWREREIKVFVFRYLPFC